MNDNFSEERSHWEGIHNDEAAQSQLPFGKGGLVIFAVTLLMLPIFGPIALVVSLIGIILKVLGKILEAIGIMSKLAKTDPIAVFGWRRSIFW